MPTLPVEVVGGDDEALNLNPNPLPHPSGSGYGALSATLTNAIDATSPTGYSLEVRPTTPGTSTDSAALLPNAQGLDLYFGGVDDVIEVGAYLKVSADLFANTTSGRNGRIILFTSTETGSNRPTAANVWQFTTVRARVTQRGPGNAPWFFPRLYSVGNTSIAGKDERAWFAGITVRRVTSETPVMTEADLIFPGKPRFSWRGADHASRSSVVAARRTSSAFRGTLDETVALDVCTNPSAAVDSSGFSAGTGNVTANRDTTVGRRTGTSFRLDGNALSASNPCQYFEVASPDHATRSYTVSAWVLAAPGIGWVMHATNASGSVFDNVSGTGTGTWQPVSLPPMAPSTWAPGWKIRAQQANASVWVTDTKITTFDQVPSRSSSSGRSAPEAAPAVQLSASRSTATATRQVAESLPATQTTASRTVTIARTAPAQSGFAVDAIGRSSIAARRVPEAAPADVPAVERIYDGTPYRLLPVPPPAIILPVVDSATEGT